MGKLLAALAALAILLAAGDVVARHWTEGQLAQRIALRHPGRVRSITSSASLPGDVGRLGAARYVRLGTVARLARMRFPEGHDGDVALAVAATRAITSPAYPVDEQEVRRMAERDQVSGIRDTAAQSRQGVPVVLTKDPTNIRLSCGDVGARHYSQPE